jgi:hypothetical protein
MSARRRQKPHKARQVSIRATDFKAQTLDPTTDFESRRRVVNNAKIRQSTSNQARHSYCTFISFNDLIKLM